MPLYIRATSEAVYDTPTPPPISFAFRNITASSNPYGTAMAVPTFSAAGDTLIFLASRQFSHGFTVMPPATATAVSGTPVDLADDYPSFAAWWIPAWNGTTSTYDFGFDGWAGERAILSFTGEASAVTAGSITSSLATTMPWLPVTLSVGQIAVAMGGVHNIADLPLTGTDPAWTERKAQGAGEWVGLGVWTHQAATAGVVSPTVGGTLGNSGRAASQILTVTP